MAASMNIEHWQDRLRQFASERDWEQFHTPKNLAMALTVEAAELLEIFQWLTPQESSRVMTEPSAGRVRDEIADILIYLLRLADVLGVDIEKAVEAKIQANAIRYDAAQVQGDATKRP